MLRWLLLLLGLALLPMRAGAVAYTFPGAMPAGCSGSSGSYSCSALTLGYGDTIAIASPKPATITINGNLSTDTSTINGAGSASDLNLIVTGALTLGYQARITANVTAASVADNGGGQVSITGNLTATSGNIALAYQSSVSGNVTVSGASTLTTGQSGSVGGSISAGTGTVTVAYASTVSGGITSNGPVVLSQSAIVNGNISAGSGAVQVGYAAALAGNLTTTGAITLAQSSQVSGNIIGGAGSVSVSFLATVVGTLTTTTGTINFDPFATANACVRSTSSSSITLGFLSFVNSVCCGTSCTTSCVVNNSFLATPPLCVSSTPTVAGFTIAGTGGASTCTPQSLTITAKDSSGNTLTSYAGTISLSTSSGRGDWSIGANPAPAGTFNAGAANSGTASYTFAAADAGIVKLQLAESLAQVITVTVVDASVPASSSTSATISYSNNAFIWAEDLGNKIAGSNIVVAGRPHDMQVSLVKKDPTTGICSVATNFNGTRNLKLWRTDNGGPWTAPNVSVGASSYGVPASRPTINNLSLAFVGGVASGLNLVTSDIGKYTLNLDDDSQTYASSTISGSLGDLTVRPFTIAVSGLALAGTANPGGSAATDAVFGKAGAAFSAAIGAYRWSSSADVGSVGIPDASATLSQVTAGGLAPSFSTSVNLAPLAGSQTPSGGVLGTLSNGIVSGFSGGAATPGTLSYSEVGSFLLNTSTVVGNYLGTAGLSLGATVFGSSGTQNNRIGRFVPAGFALSNASISHRSSLACSPASTFTYLGENFQVGFTLTAQNTAGSTTQNYTGSFAKLDLTTPTNLALGGISGTTMFKVGGRLSTSASSGIWTSGVAAVSLTAQVARASSPDGPFDTAQFGIAPQDGDGTGMVSLNLDTDSPPNGVDRALLGTIPLRQGRLRLQNGISAPNRSLRLPLTAQYWNSTAYVTNTLDSCTSITSVNLSFGNLQKTLKPVDAVMSPSSVTVNPVNGSFITLAAPGSGRLGSIDIAIALSSTATDASCLKTPGGWTPTIAASAGANMPGLQGAWCGSSPSNDPSARATWGLYRGSDGVIYQRENF